MAACLPHVAQFGDEGPGLKAVRKDNRYKLTTKLMRASTEGMEREGTPEEGTVLEMF